MYRCYVLRYTSVFFFKQKTAYEMRISDWSSDVCSSDLVEHRLAGDRPPAFVLRHGGADRDFGKARARRQVEAQCALAIAILPVAGADDLRDRAADQRLVTQAERAGQCVGNIGDAAMAVGFPEPAAARLLIFAEQPVGTLRPQVPLV